jgi:hypothetical protein
VKLTYQTGIGTLIQFILLSFLTLGSQVVSVVTTCTSDGGNCIGNLLTSVIFYILVAVVFGSIWLIGLWAQDQRSKRLALLLLGIEGMIALVSLFSLKLSLHDHKNVFGLIASFSIFLMACWIMLLAYRLMKAEGRRVAAGGRRRRRHPTPEL